MFRLFKDTTIYIFCPAQTTTGGPEALHQLCDAINLQGGKARMVYIDYSTEQIVRASKPLVYKIYYTESTTVVRDEEKNIAVVPEIWPHLLRDYRKIQKSMWWLSVNYLRNEDIFSKKGFVHLYQSYYAGKFLEAKGEKTASALYDYVNVFPRKNLNKKNWVCYNPKKGFTVTNRILEACHEGPFTFVPLEGFSKKELMDTLSESKVYIDFGDHPGKDRIPREAALAGNIIISSKSGSAYYHEDLPIPEQYKFESDNVKGAAQAIANGMTNYKSLIPDFDEYKQTIISQKNEFFQQTKSLFLGPNVSALEKISGWVLHKLLPVRFFVTYAEWARSRVEKGISASAKKRLKKLFYLKKNTA